MIVTTTREDTLLLRLLLDSMSLEATHPELPEGTAVAVPSRDSILEMMEELGFSPLDGDRGGESENQYGNPELDVP